MNTTIIRARYSKDGPECCLGKDNQVNNQVGRNRDACVAMKPMDTVLTQPGKLAWGVGRPHFRHSGVLASGSADQMAAFSAKNTEFSAEFRNNIIFQPHQRRGFLFAPSSCASFTLF
jgi:hypothetical protein